MLELCCVLIDQRRALDAEHDHTWERSGQGFNSDRYRARVMLPSSS